jgi:hypothetical protein
MIHRSSFMVENLVRRSWSEKIGFAIDQLCHGFQVSGFRCLAANRYLVAVTQLVSGFVIRLRQI